MDNIELPDQHQYYPHYPKGNIDYSCLILPYFIFSPASVPPNSNDAVIYITIHIFQGIKSQRSTCVPGDVLRWNLTKRNMWSGELKQRRGQGGKPDESDCGFSESEEFGLLRERLEKKLVPPHSMNAWLKPYNLIYIWIIISISVLRHFHTSCTLATIV